MRITDSLFYLNSKNSYQDSMKKLYDVNAQISSGSKIQNSYEDSGIYVDSMRLDNEIATLGQVKESSSKAATFANNTDATMNQFNDTLIKFKSKLIQAANAANSPTSLGAIANDLQAMRTHLQSIANTSIDGQYLFSGSALDVKPVSNDGTYNGNEESMSSLIGSNTKLAYNIDGKSLFLGKDSDYKKIVSTNVKMYSDGDKTKILKTSDTVEDLMLNNGGGPKGANTNAHFYIQGKNSDGSSFKKKIDINPADKIENLITKIKDSYTPTDSVDVSLNDYGQIEIKDKNSGRDSLDFSMVGSYDLPDANGSIDNLTNVVSFVKSNFTSSDVAFDRNKFIASGDTLSSNVSQFVKSTSDYATASTKLSDVAGSTSLDTKQLKLTGKDLNANAFDTHIDFSNAATGTTFTIGGNTYTVFNADGNPTKADHVTYQQLNDVVGMIVSNNLPQDTNTNGQIDFDEYNKAVKDSKSLVDVSLDYRGRLQIKDKTNPSTKIEFSMYDSTSNDFSNTNGNSLSFMSNNAIATDEPHVDFFKELDSMITAVRSGNFSMDSNFSDPRNPGIENSILRIDHVMDHVEKLHTKIGSYSNALQSAGERVDFLSLNVKTIKSQVADVDIGEAYMNFTQISNNYQATLSTVAKINSMSLLNYM